MSFRLLLGNDRLLASHRALADGVISGCTSGIPELITAIDRAATRDMYLGKDGAVVPERAAPPARPAQPATTESSEPVVTEPPLAPFTAI